MAEGRRADCADRAADGAAGAEKVRREQETAELAAQHEQLAETRANALAEGMRLTEEAGAARADDGAGCEAARAAA
jgi:hypothetical protein